LRLALWCEAHGLNPEKMRHLAAAVLSDPKNAVARALLGLVDDGGKWRDPGAVAERVKADEALSRALASYNARRDKTPNTADAQWKLALWCEQNGLKAEATAHLVAATRLDPGHEAAWKRLGYSKHDGVWKNPERLAAEKAAREVQDQADRLWRPRLTAWKIALADARTHDEAERSLEAVSDPLALPAIWQVFVAGKKSDPLRAVAMLGRLEGPAVSRALAVLAVRGATAEVRRAARETLRRRDVREFLDTLIGFLDNPRAPVSFEFKLNGSDHFGSPGVIRARQGNNVFQEIYTVDEAFQPPMGYWRPVFGVQQASPLAASAANTVARVASQANPADRARATAAVAPLAALGQATSNAAGQPVLLGYTFEQVLRPDAEERAALLKDQMTSNVAGLQATSLGISNANATTAVLNAETDAALHDITGTDPGHDQEDWRAWWADQQGYAYERRPPEEPAPVNVVTTWVHLSCFAAGTPVKTVGGYTPIESIKVGDRALTQDPDTGRLSFQPIVAVYHNKPSATLEIAFESGSTVVATGIHRFWKAGHGWMMARDLKPGDPIRTVGGLDRVARVTDNVVQPVFNMEVAQGQSFFVGKEGLLVHDNSLVQPVTAPFDAVAELTTAAQPH
jgi:hypothetical protein